MELRLFKTLYKLKFYIYILNASGKAIINNNKSYVKLKQFRNETKGEQNVKTRVIANYFAISASCLCWRNKNLTKIAANFSHWIKNSKKNVDDELCYNIKRCASCCWCRQVCIRIGIFFRVPWNIRKWKEKFEYVKNL